MHRGVCDILVITSVVVGNMLIIRIWDKDNGPWMQALHFVFGLGSLAAPLVAEPCLYEMSTQSTQPYLNTTDANQNYSMNRTDTQIEYAGGDPGGFRYVYFIIATCLLVSASLHSFLYLTGDR